LSKIKLRSKCYFALYNFAVILFFLVIIEFLTGFFLRNPEHIPHKLLAIFREYYMINDRFVIQAVPDFSIYDDELLYTLKPGRFNFKNREFNNSFQVNSLGMRDDENSLQFPEIIACGDSYTMGWGVSQNESFPEIIEHKIKKRVLNTGISTYGTVREILSLKGLKTDSLKYLIIQYSDNDFEENRDYIRNNFSLKITSKVEFEALCNKHVKNQNYFPFKHIIFFPKIIAKWIIGKPVGVFDAGKSVVVLSEQKAFLQIINQAKFLPENIKIIVFNLDYRKSKADFIPLLIKELENFPELKKKMILIDFSKSLNDNHFYILDDHLNSKGHLFIAESIIHQLK